MDKTIPNRLMSPDERRAAGHKFPCEYKLTISKGILETLANVAEASNLHTSKLVLGAGLGTWTIPPAMLAKHESVASGWATLALTIHSDEWKRLRRKARGAFWPVDNPQPRLIDPARFCLFAAMGHVRLHKPGPNLLEAEARDALADLHHALWLAQIWNPWMLPTPPVEQLDQGIAAAREQLLKTGIKRGDYFEFEMVRDAVWDLQQHYQGTATAITLRLESKTTLETLWQLIVGSARTIAKPPRP